jgi:hypothetical protein
MCGNGLRSWLASHEVVGENTYLLATPATIARFPDTSFLSAESRMF